MCNCKFLKRRFLREISVLCLSNRAKACIGPCASTQSRSTASMISNSRVDTTFGRSPFVHGSFSSIIRGNFVFHRFTPQSPEDHCDASAAPATKDPSPVANDPDEILPMMHRFFSVLRSDCWLLLLWKPKVRGVPHHFSVLNVLYIRTYQVVLRSTPRLNLEVRRKSLCQNCSLLDSSSIINLNEHWAMIKGKEVTTTDGKG